MAGRRSRGRTFRSGGRTYQWHRFQINAVVIDDAAIDNFIVVPVNATTTERQSATLVRSILSFSLSSQNVARNEDANISAVLQLTETNAAGVSQNVIDPISTNLFDLGNGDVLGWWKLEVSQTTVPTANTQAVFRNSYLQSMAKRKLKMRVHQVTLAVSGQAAEDTQWSCVLGCLLQY